MSLLEEFLNLVLPTQCAICGTSGSSICQDCQNEYFYQPRRVSRFDLSGFSSCLYEKEVAAVIQAAKEDGQTAILKTMAKSMAKSMAKIITTFAPADSIYLVPIPSKKSSTLNRGYNPTTLLAAGVARHLAQDFNLLVKVGDILKLNRDVLDQASLSGQERRNNLIGAMSLKKNLERQSVSNLGAVWLVDDVVTTGATIREAARCLREAGLSISGFLVFAETLPKNIRQNSKSGSKLAL